MSGNDTHDSRIVEAGKFVLHVSTMLTSVNVEITIFSMVPKEIKMNVGK